jgi:hypothetical protein
METFKGDYYTKRAQVRQQIDRYLAKKTAGETVPTWHIFRSTLLDRGASAAWIKDKLRELGLKEDANALVKA